MLVLFVLVASFSVAETTANTSIPDEVKDPHADQNGWTESLDRVPDHSRTCTGPQPGDTTSRGQTGPRQGITLGLPGGGANGMERLAWSAFDQTPKVAFMDKHAQERPGHLPSPMGAWRLGLSSPVCLVIHRCEQDCLTKYPINSSKFTRAGSSSTSCRQGFATASAALDAVMAVDELTNKYTQRRKPLTVSPAGRAQGVRSDGPRAHLAQAGRSGCPSAHHRGPAVPSGPLLHCGPIGWPLFGPGSCQGGRAAG